MKKIFLTAALALVSSFAFAQQIACVNYEELVSLCPEADAARAQMAEAYKINNDYLNDMRMAFQKSVEEYDKNKNVWSQTILTSKQTELSQLEERIQTTYNQMQQELQQKQAELMAPVQQKVRGVVAALAKEAGVVYVFNYNDLVFIEESKAINLTAKARVALNIPEGRTMESLQQELQAQMQAEQGGQQ